MIVIIDWQIDTHRMCLSTFLSAVGGGGGQCSPLAPPQCIR